MRPKGPAVFCTETEPSAGICNIYLLKKKKNLVDATWKRVK